MKTQVPDTQVVKSLKNLKTELEGRNLSYDVTARELLFKINSCLFSNYPSIYKKDSK